MTSTTVMLLADTPAAENKDIVQAMVYLLENAKADKLAAVLCTHSETGAPATMLCAMHVIDPESKSAQYIPLGMLFTDGNTPWVDYIPPASAIAVDTDNDRSNES